MSSSASLKSVRERGWCNNELKFNKFSYRWTIDNFSYRKEKLTSPYFLVGSDQDTKWRLCMDPVLPSNCNIMRIYLTLAQCKNSVRAKVNFSIIGEGGKAKAEFEGSEITLYHQNVQSRGDIERKLLLDKKNGLLPNDTLTVVCDLDVLVDTVVTHGHQNQVNVFECNLGHDFAKLLHTPEFSDCTLNVKGSELKVHKTILSARSPVFAAMFKHGMKEAQQQCIDISDIQPEVMQQVLEFIYTRNAPKLDEEMAMHLLAAADKYQLDRLKRMCENAMYGGITPENASQMLVVSHLHSADQLKTHAIRCINANADRVVESEGWSALIINYPQLVSEVVKAKNSNK